YYHVHLSRLNPFSCAKLTTFTVIYKAYGGEHTVELFMGFFNLTIGGTRNPSKINFLLQSMKIPCFSDLVGILSIFEPSRILSSFSLALNLRGSMVNSSLRSLLVEGVFTYSGDFYIASPLLINDLFSSFAEMAFKNFMYAEDDEDLSFLTCKPSLGFGTGSPSISINNEHPSFEIEPL
ncbi:hypothetical protein Tco_0041291, partial [Tanacetum coccineum]